jgi:oxygen-independent coproporphyrinogen-3 oxidase
MIEMLMCDFQIDAENLEAEFPGSRPRIDALLRSAADQFGDALVLRSGKMTIAQEARALTRIIARHFDDYNMSGAGHASAI